MRVLGLFHGYVPYHNAGAELTVHAMLAHLAGLGHEVDVLLSQNRPGAPVDDPYDHDGVTVWPFHSTGDVARHLHRKRPNVIVSHLENQPRACALGARDSYDIPVVHILHNTQDFSKWALRDGRADLAVFNTDWMREDFERWFGRQGMKMPPNITLHPPVYPENYATTLPTPVTHAVTLINLWEGKGGRLFWELAKRMPTKKFLGVRGAYGVQEEPPGWETSGEYDNVTVWGHVPPSRMGAVYGATRVLLMPSEYESYGRTSVEAACAGIPTIAHPTPGLREALGDSGTFVDRDDIDGWVKAISRLTTPKGWAVASRKAKECAARQTPTADLDRFAQAVGKVATRGLASTGGSARY